ncbi:hypothetical protein HNR44_001927 [Geomicrobium halophilum]|uniref:Uncharacterized protein n=1 Tax=Geomicrobium halophilum TaxID=549000 RepID=A0A841PMI7_9BACL|nr:hypothetical protein [Geomicrobium halophilum]MBB6449949.1 hypothetical protein [Geomicrobium halophilum]
METSTNKLTFKEKYLKAVKQQKPKTTSHTVIGFIITLGILIVFL